LRTGRAEKTGRATGRGAGPEGGGEGRGVGAIELGDGVTADAAGRDRAARRGSNGSAGG
jgi:hypothetical protein